MGIKFKNKVTTGIPATGDIEERELSFDLKNGRAYSSTNGSDVVNVSGIAEDDYANQLGTIGGTAKFKLDAVTATLYITTDGTDAG